MKKALLLSLALLAGTQIACAQSLGYTPPAQAAFLGSGTPTTWSPYTAASGSGALSYTPPAIGLYCQASPPSGPWTPCNPGSGGGGATLPFPGLVFATSATAGRVALGSDIANLITTETGCSTSGFVWVPASNTCVAQSGGSPGGSTGALQYNNGGTFGGSANATLSSGGSLAVTSVLYPRPLPFVISKASSQSIQLIFPTALPIGYTVQACGTYPCIAYSSIASTTSSTLIFAKNGTTFCTVTFAATATVGTFSGCTQTAFTYTNNTTFDILTMTWSGDPSAIPAVYITEI